MPQAIVIGGGPAGSLAALLLTRAGFEVQLFEQHRFPRDKVCGECLSALGWDVLARAGLADRIRRLGAVRLTRTVIYPGQAPSLELGLPRPMWGLTRRELDRALLAAAIAEGVAVRQPARCEWLAGGDRPQVRWRDLVSNEQATATADWVVVADGKGALLPRPARATGDLGIKTHFERVHGPRDAIELFAGPGCYGGLAAVEGNRWNAAFSVPASALLAAKGDVQAVFAMVEAFNPALAARLNGASRAGPWLSAPLPRAPVRETWPRHVVPVGNAAAALEPIGGEGMGLALRSAELAVQAIRSRTSLLELRPTFNQLWRVRRAACHGIARVVATPDLSDAVATLLHHHAWFGHAALGWAGKTEGGIVPVVEPQ